MLSQLRLIGPSEAETQAKAAAERKAKADSAMDSKVPEHDEDELMEKAGDGKQRRTGLCPTRPQTPPRSPRRSCHVRPPSP